MTTIEDSSLPTKKPSSELLNLIEDLKYNLIKAKDLFVTIVNKAREEGFDDKEIDMLLYSNLKEIIPKTTLLRYRKEFIPIAVNKRNNNVSNDTLTNITEQSPITSGPFGLTDDDFPNHRPQEILDSHPVLTQQPLSADEEIEKEKQEEEAKNQVEPRFQKYSDITEHFDQKLGKTEEEYWNNSEFLLRQLHFKEWFNSLAAE
jgi:hypothetical protein